MAENKYTATEASYVLGVKKYDVGDLLTYNPSTGTFTKANSLEEATADPAKVDQIKFNWQEYFKIKLKADWYTKVYQKLTLRTLGEFGFLGAYNQDRGVIPFERFHLGGSGMANFTMDGRETIQLRGYPDGKISPIITSGERKGDPIGATVYNKFSLELRYPITLKQSASIYGMVFIEGGNAFENFKTFNPFDLKRSAGVGLRVFMPAFGLLGIDFAHGFDSIVPNGAPSGWQTHFIIGQQF